MNFTDIIPQITTPLAKNIRYDGSLSAFELSNYLNRVQPNFLSKIGFQDKFNNLQSFKQQLLVIYKHINQETPPKSQRTKNYDVEEDKIKIYIIDGSNIIYLVFKTILTPQELAFIAHHLRCTIEIKDMNIAILKP